MSDDDGTLEVGITYLEMRSRPRRHSHDVERTVALMRAVHPPLHFYRYLYETVGAPWLWYERRVMDDDELSAIVHDEAVEIFVLYADGCPAGYAELDCRSMPDVELAYCGLVPDFIGEGLGVYLVDHAVELAWQHEPERVWVHTCTLDHPRALLVYQRAGFQPIREETKIIADPRKSGAMRSRLGNPG
ncbi:MAG TPA: GNAT family N-acetyltransferase [Nannocystaceae bacterium]|nr:GNAT family N-acetyltransferase [Nannocystaceae bacterium]